MRERIDGAELAGTRPSRRTAWAIAATLVVAAAGLGWYVARPHDVEWRVASTAAGERIVIRLADSSVVTLGPASTVRYAIGMSKRDVELVGLADFKVVHDAQRPFVVRAGNAVATDLGTEFVVRAYRDDSLVQVSVTEGAVSLARSGGSSAIELRPGEVGHVATTDEPRLDTRPAARTYAAWLNGRLVFDDAPLADVAKELARWFDVDVRIASDALARRKVSAIYNSPSLTGVLDALGATLDVRVERIGRTITISERQR